MMSFYFLYCFNGATVETVYVECSVTCMFVYVCRW